MDNRQRSWQLASNSDMPLSGGLYSNIVKSWTAVGVAT